MKYVLVFLTIILAVLKESYPLNPEILKYDQYMKDFETTGRRIKQETKDEKLDGTVVKREDGSSTVTISDSGTPSPQIYTFNNDTESIEIKFLEHVDKEKKVQNTSLSTWNTDQRKALCERALDDTRQYSFGFQSYFDTKSVLFNHVSHESVKLNILKCPADNSYIYESRGKHDCYLILSQKKFKNVRPMGYLYIQYEKCGLGLMSDTGVTR